MVDLGHGWWRAWMRDEAIWPGSWRTGLPRLTGMRCLRCRGTTLCRRVEDVHSASELLLLLLREMLQRHRDGRSGHGAHMTGMSWWGLLSLLSLAQTMLCLVLPTLPVALLLLMRSHPHSTRLQLPRRQHRLDILRMLLHRIDRARSLWRSRMMRVSARTLR